MLLSSSSLVGNLVGGGEAEACSELKAEFGDRKSEIQAAPVRALGYNGRRKGRGEEKKERGGDGWPCRAPLPVKGPCIHLEHSLDSVHVSEGADFQVFPWEETSPRSPSLRLCYPDMQYALEATILTASQWLGNWPAGRAVSSVLGVLLLTAKS